MFHLNLPPQEPPWPLNPGAQAQKYPPPENQSVLLTFSHNLLFENLI